MVFLIRKKKQPGEQRSPIGASKNRHVVVRSIILAIFILTTIAAPGFAAENGISWTEDELAFMAEHPVIRLGIDPGFVPFEFMDEDGEYKGIAADYLALISEKTGLRFEAVKGLTWPQAYDMALAKGVDALPAIGKTSEREEHFLFSEPYYYYICTIAEGVEHEEQKQYLQAHGCDMIQGYLISKPLDPEAALEFLIKQNQI